MNELHADPVTAEVTAAEATTATSYGDLTTVGPSVTKSLVNGQKVIVTISCRLDTPAVATTEGFMSWTTTGVAANDSNACRATSNSAGTMGQTVERSAVFTAGSTASFTFTCKYKSSSGAATYTFRERRIIIKPF